jgi:hypothetical protein
MILPRRRHAQAHDAVSCGCTGRLRRTELSHLPGTPSFSNALTLFAGGIRLDNLRRFRR